METRDKYRARFGYDEAVHVIFYVRSRYVKTVSIRNGYFLYVALNFV